MHEQQEASPSFPFARTSPFDPPPVVAELRERCPVSKVELFNGAQAWLVTRYDQVREVCVDPRFSADTTDPGYPEVFAGRSDVTAKERTFIAMDPPEHDQHRRLLTKFFTVKRAESMRADIQQVVDGLVDDLERTTSQDDLVEHFALPLPTWVICKLLGVPGEDHAFFQERAGARLDVRRSGEEVGRATTELIDYLADLVERKRAEPSDDILSALLVTAVDSGIMSNHELVDMARMLLIAGHESTASMIALSVLVLLEHPDQLAELRIRPELWPSAVEELLRLLTIPQVLVGRTATADVEIGGVIIRAGEGVRALLNSANRDAEVFPEPDRFDIHRNARQHLSFGFGVHQCLGQNLARVEMQVALETLFRRLPNLRLAVPLAEVPVKYESAVHGVRAVPVRW